MSTQGLISIIDKDTKEVLIKIVTGSDGNNIDKVVSYIKKPLENLKEDYTITFTESKNTLKWIYRACLLFGFGGDDDLVVYSSTCMVSDDPEEDLFPSRWKDTFNIPEFNPRWDRGTAAYFKIIEI